MCTYLSVRVPCMSRVGPKVLSGPVTDLAVPPDGGDGNGWRQFKVKVKVQVPWMFSHSRVTTVSYRDTEYNSKYLLCTSTRVLFMHGRKSKFHDPSSCSNAFVRVAWGCLATETLGRGKGAHQSGGLWSTTVWAS